MINLQNKKVLMVIASEDFQDHEYSQTRRVLEESGIQVTVASSKLGECTGKFSSRVNSDILLSDVQADNFDALIFIGGPGALEYTENQTALDLVKEFFNSRKLVAAICIAPVILARAGILKGKKATVFETGSNDLLRLGCEYTGTDVEVDGSIVTASGPPAAEKFGKKIVEMLE